MSEFVLGIEQIRFFLSRCAPTAQIADLQWVMGDEEAARSTYHGAAEDGDVDALITLALCAPPDGVTVTLYERVLAILSTGHFASDETLRAALDALTKVVAFRLRDCEAAAKLGLLAFRHFDVAPIPFFRLSLGQESAEDLTAAIDTALTRAVASQDPAERTGHLLVASALGAEAGRHGVPWYRRLLEIAQHDAPESVLFLVLGVLDSCDPDQRAADENEELFDHLAETLGDDEERLTYRLRRLEALASRGDSTRVTDVLKELSTLPDAPNRATILEHCQRAAIEVSDFAAAAEVCQARARRTSDARLTTALLLQAEMFLRLSKAAAPALQAVARELVDWCRRTERSSAIMARHAFQVLEGCLLQSGDVDQLRRLWDEPGFADHLGGRTLSSLLLREDDERVLPPPSEAPRFLRNLCKVGTPAASRALLSLVICSEGWSTLASELEVESQPEPSRRQLSRLQAYACLFRRDDAHAALEVLEGLYQAGDHSLETLLLAWEASRRTGAFRDWSERFITLAAENQGSEPWAVLAGATYVENGDSDRAREAVQEVTAPDSPVVLLLNRQIQEVQEQALQLERSAPTLVRERASARREVADAMVEAERALAEGSSAAAAGVLVKAAEGAISDDPGLAAALILRADVALPDRPPEDREKLLRRALDLDEGNNHVRFALFRLLEQQERWVEAGELVAELTLSEPPDQVPMEGLRRTGKALFEQQPELSGRVFGLVVECAAAQPDARLSGDDLDQYCESARRSGRISYARDRLERLVAHASSGSHRGELNLRLGELFATELRDVDLAVEHLRRALNAPETRDRAGRKLRTLLEEQNRWEELVEVLLTISEYSEHSEKIEVLMASAEVLWDRLDRPEAAAEALEMLLAIQPKHSQALLRLAEYHRQNEEWEQVINYLETAARLVEDKVDRSQVYQKLGEIYQMHLERPSLALENYLVSFVCDSANRETFNRLDRLYTATGRFKDLAGLIDIAIETTRNAPEDSPFDLEELYARRARIEYRHLDTPRKAAESLLQALRLNPANTRYIKLLEAHLLDQADPSILLEAYQIHSKGLQADDPEQVELLRAQADLCERMPDRASEAVRLYSRLLELDPADRESARKLSRFHKDAGQWNELIELHRNQLNWVTKPEETVSLYHKIARVYESELRDLGAAARTYEELLKLVPGSVSALRSLGRLFEATREWDRLIEVSETEVRLVEDDRVRAHLLFKIGSVYETHRTDEDKAISYYERAVDNDPRCVPALHGLRDLHQRRGDTERVIEYLEREALIWDSSRERSSIHTRIAEVYWVELKDGEKAIDHLRQALELVPDSGLALHTLLDVHYKQEAWSEAAPIAYSLSQHPESMRADRRGELFFRRSVIARNLGNRREAIDSLKIALDIAPDSAQAFDLLAEILAEEGDADAHAEFFARLQKELKTRDDTAGLARVKRFLGRQAENRLDLREALALFNEAIELDTDSVSALRDFVRVLVRQRSFSEALAHTEHFARHAEQPEVARSAHVIAAGILLDHLGRRSEARELIHSVLAVDDCQVEALYLGAQAAFLDKDWREARACMETLVDVDIAAGGNLDRATRAEHVFYLGRIVEVGFEDDEEALSCYALAREAYPVDPRPLKAAAGVLFRQENWTRLDNLVDRALRGAAAYGGEEATAPLLLFAARLSQAREQQDRAEEYLKQLLEIDSQHQEARSMLVELVGGEEVSDRAAAELRALLESNTFDSAALKGLAAVHSRRGQPVAAACFERVLTLTGIAGDELVQTIPEALRGPLDTPLSADLVSQFVVPAALQNGYLELLRCCGPHLRTMGLVVEPAPLARSQALEDDEEEMVGRVVEQVSQLLPHEGSRLLCYREGPRGTAVSVTVLEEPTIQVELSTELSSVGSQSEARFLLAHATNLLHRITYPLLAAPRADLTALLWWFSRWRELGQAAPPVEDAPWLPQMSQPFLEHLYAIMLSVGDSMVPLNDPQHAQRLAIEMEEAVVEESDRVGLIVSNDLEASINALLKIETGAELFMLTHRVPELSRSRRITDLVRYSLSTEFMALLELKERRSVQKPSVDS